jgi:hypothetical protein
VEHDVTSHSAALSAVKRVAPRVMNRNLIDAIFKIPTSSLALHPGR